jgi:hypothetical protein
MTTTNEAIIISKEEAYYYNHYQILALEKLAESTGRLLIVEGK